LDWRRAWDEVLQLVFPPRCGVCGQLGEPALCPSCSEEIEYLLPPYCARCGKALLPTAGPPLASSMCASQVMPAVMQT